MRRGEESDGRSKAIAAGERGQADIDIIDKDVEVTMQNTVAERMTFAEVVDSVEQLTPDEQESIIEIFQRRVRDRRREEILKSIEESRREFAEGKLVPSTVDEIMERVLR